LFRIEVISSGWICMEWLLDRRGSLRLRDLLAKLVQTVSDRGVEDEVADAEHDPSEDVRIDVARQLDLEAGLVPDPIADALHRGFVAPHRAGPRTPQPR